MSSETREQLITIKTHVEDAREEIGKLRKTAGKTLDRIGTVDKEHCERAAVSETKQQAVAVSATARGGGSRRKPSSGSGPPRPRQPTHAKNPIARSMVPTGRVKATANMSSAPKERRRVERRSAA